MKKWAALSFLVTCILVLLLPRGMMQWKFFIGAFGFGLAVVLLMIGVLPWEKDNE